MIERLTLQVIEENLGHAGIEGKALASSSDGLQPAPGEVKSEP
jgi:hypothetical protein